MHHCPWGAEGLEEGMGLAVHGGEVLQHHQRPAAFLGVELQVLHLQKEKKGEKSGREGEDQERKAERRKDHGKLEWPGKRVLSKGNDGGKRLYGCPRQLTTQCWFYEFAIRLGRCPASKLQMQRRQLTNMPNKAAKLLARDTRTWCKTAKAVNPGPHCTQLAELN